MADDAPTTTVKFRYALGPGTRFARDAEIGVDNASVTYQDMKIEGATVDKVEVIEDGAALEITATVPIRIIPSAAPKMSIGFRPNQ